MNSVALISAIIGLSILIFIVVFGNKIRNRWVRYTSVAVGIVVAIGITGSIPPLLGDTEVSTSAKAGEYLLYLGVAVVIIKSVFFKKKANAGESNA